MEQRTKKIEAAEAPWQNCIAVCEKCAGKIDAMDGAKTKLRVALKALIAQRGIKKQVRAVDSSCFDICPENGITVVHFSSGGVRAVIFSPDATAADILEDFGF